MSDDVRDLLLRQFRIACALLNYHLQELGTAECLWRPARQGLHVHQDSDSIWRADWPEHERYTLGPPSIAWTTWHIDFWWSMTLNHHFGDGTLERQRILWPGSADGVRATLAAHCAKWEEILQPNTDPARSLPLEARWPFQDRPFEDVAAWVNLELMKNAAEIGTTRFLYAVRSE